MKALCASLFGALGLWALSIGGTSGQEKGLDPRAGLAQTESKQEGIEVQARGPVHEAFAQPVIRGQGPSPVIAKKPPEPINELPAEQRPEAEHVEWITGYWAWDEDRGDFLWVSGLWRVPPPQHHWMPGYWHQVEGGWERVT